MKVRGVYFAQNLIADASEQPCSSQCRKTAHTMIHGVNKSHNFESIHRSHFEDLFDCEKLDF